MSDTDSRHPVSARAAAVHEPETASFGPFSLRTRLLEKNGVPVKLGGRATDILRLLLSRAGEVIPRRKFSPTRGQGWSSRKSACGSILRSCARRSVMARRRTLHHQRSQPGILLRRSRPAQRVGAGPGHPIVEARPENRRRSRCRTGWSGWSEGRTSSRICRPAY